MECLADVTLTQEELDELLRDLPQLVLELEASRDYSASEE
ncbi:hypothetical protein SAMN04488500_11540 [Sporomusa malonica]|uniref:Uncharacterized protein n=1 Tax=Sporomusa malonica TaxID=112901 RepID=A0A1W2DEY8_9FIRM|nr:hypothetical protein SAMN04488500_11540 [Sporomusa malonica]